MVAPAKNRKTRSRPTVAPVVNKLRQRVTLEYRDINELHNYEFNPRDNEPAIESVANSIRTFGFIIPVVVGANNIIAAGHTRVAAAKSLGMDEVPVIQAEHLTDEELAAFRIIDNKVAELSRWDFDLLAGEIDKIKGSGLTLTDFGWTREEIDCMSSVVSDDCLNVDNLVDERARESMRNMERRAPSTARFVLGEIVFFIPASDYRDWVNGIRTLYDYNDGDIIASIKQRLGITEQSVVSAERARRTRPSPRTTAS